MKKNWRVVVCLFLLICMVGVGNVRAGIDDGLVASYTFSGNAVDSSGHNHNAIVHGAQLTADRFGSPDSAYIIGPSNYIEIPPAIELDLKEQMERSISIWVKPADTSGNDHGSCGPGMETIFASTNGEEGSCASSPMGGRTPADYATIGYWFGFRDGKLQFYLRNNEEKGTNFASVESIAAPAVGAWSHIVISISTVYDVSSHVAGENFGRVWVYINGVKQVLPGPDYDYSDVLGQPTAIIPFPADYTHDKSLYIGGRYYDRTPCYSPCVLDFSNLKKGVGEFFAGAVDDLRIYNRVLSGDEVKQLKNMGGSSSPSEPQADGPYNYYLPYFKSTGSYWSGVGISNSQSDKPANYSLFVYDQAGNLVKTVYPDPLPVNGQASMAVRTEHDTTGWIWINSQLPLTGLSFFAKNLMADVPFVSKLSRNLVIPHIAQDGYWDTSLMICNPSDAPADISLACYNRQGVQVAFTGFTLPARNSEVYPFTNFGKDEVVGSVKISVAGGAGVAAFALYTNEKIGGSYFAGIDAVTITPDTLKPPF